MFQKLQKMFNFAQGTSQGRKLWLSHKTTSQAFYFVQYIVWNIMVRVQIYQDITM